MSYSPSVYLAPPYFGASYFGTGGQSGPTQDPPSFGRAKINGHDCIEALSGEYLVVPGTFQQPITIYVVLRVQSSPPSSSAKFAGDPTLFLGSFGSAFNINTITRFDGHDPSARLIKIFFNGPSSSYSLDGGADVPVSLPSSPMENVCVGVFYDESDAYHVQFSEFIIYSGELSEDSDHAVKDHLLNKYARFRYEEIINAIKDSLTAAPPASSANTYFPPGYFARTYFGGRDAAPAPALFTPAQVSAAINPQPYPTANGPLVYLYPRAQTVSTPHIGAGRYFYQFDGMVTARVVNKSFKDKSNEDFYKLMYSDGALLSAVNSVVDKLHLSFFYDANGLPLTVEPVYVESQAAPRLYRLDKGAGEYIYVDIDLLVKHQSRIFPRTPDLTTQGPPVPRTLQEVLNGFVNLIKSTNIFNPKQVTVSLDPQPYPFAESPYCYVSPGRFATDVGTTIGGGRNLTVMDGEVTVWTAMTNRTDLTTRASYMLLNFDPTLGLLKRIAALLDRLQVTFPVGDDGRPVTLVPIFCTEIGDPVYFRGAPNTAMIPAVFSVKYWNKFT